MSLVSIKQLRNLPLASSGATIIYNGTANIWSNQDTRGIQISSGTTAERPASPTVGLLRYNTDNNQLEYWDGSVWVQIYQGPKKFVFDFDQTDLVSDVLTVSHGLNDDWCQVTVYDDTRQVIVPTSVISVDDDNITIDLSSFTPISGTWRAVIVGG